MKRGDVYLADLNPVKGSEQAERRPVLIFQDDLLITATLTGQPDDVAEHVGQLEIHLLQGLLHLLDFGGTTPQ